jgi:hypothetical protein
MPLPAFLLALLGGSSAAGAGTAAGTALTAGELAAAGAGTGVALAPATGASAVGAGAAPGMGMSSLMGMLSGGKGKGNNASGMLQALQGQMGPQAPMQSPPSTPMGELSRPAPQATRSQKMDMMLDRFGGPQGVMSMLQGMKSTHKPAPPFPGQVPATPTQNPFETALMERPLVNLGMGRVQRRGRRR